MSTSTSRESETARSRPSPPPPAPLSKMLADRTAPREHASLGLPRFNYLIEGDGMSGHPRFFASNDPSSRNEPRADSAPDACIASDKSSRT